MSDVQTLVMNKVRKALEELEREHVGYIDSENMEFISYQIDDRIIGISVKDWMDSDGRPVRT